VNLVKSRKRAPLAEAGRSIPVSQPRTPATTI
jgi:hypothetical protein